MVDADAGGAPLRRDCVALLPDCVSAKTEPVAPMPSTEVRKIFRFILT